MSRHIPYSLITLGLLVGAVPIQPILDFNLHPLLKLIPTYGVTIECFYCKINTNRKVLDRTREKLKLFFSKFCKKEKKHLVQSVLTRRKSQILDFFYFPTDLDRDTNYEL